MNIAVECLNNLADFLFCECMNMRAIEFDFGKAGFPEKTIRETAGRLGKRIAELRTVVAERDYSSPAASLILPQEKKFAAESKNLAPRYRDSSTIIVVGIGGSNLGTMAVQEAVLGKYANLLGKKRIFYADTVDADSFRAITELAKKSEGNVLINAISKSGTTTETNANFNALTCALGEKASVIVTGDAGSKTLAEAEKNGYDTLTVPPAVGGRYSVFSNVGLFPLAAMGVNISALLEGATDAVDGCLEESTESPAAVIAALVYLHWKKGIRIHNQFLFSNDLESTGKWYRQLMAESIGKKGNGVTPTVSIGTTDLHSMAQLYFNTKSIFHRMVRVKKWKNANTPEGRKLKTIMGILADSAEEAFANRRKPFIKLALKDKSEYAIGQLLQLEMIEMMLLAKLMGVNPFGQPDVERYKKIARKKLGGGN